MNPTSQIDWIPVTERLPAVDREHRYMVATPDNMYLATREASEFEAGREDWVAWIDFKAYAQRDDTLPRYILDPCRITHWAELPAVPRDVHLVEIPIGENCLLLCTEKAKES